MSTRKAKKDPEWKIALREAIDEAGSLSELGRRVGTSHNRFTMALKGKNISAELAVAVAQVTSVPKHRLRPDLWGPDD